MQVKRTVENITCAPKDAYRTVVEFWGNLFKNPGTPGPKGVA